MTDIKRRLFLKNAVSAGMGSVLTNSLHDETAVNFPLSPAFAIPHNPRPKKVIVAGAGLAGLCCAYELMKKGHEVVVLEASGRHGGHVLTVRDGLSDGLYADGGAEQITRPGYERYWEYTKEFDLTVLPYPEE